MNMTPKDIIDYWVLGEADYSIVHLANQIKNSKSISSNIYSGRDFNFTEFRNSRIKFIENDLLFPNEAVVLELDRGCNFNCSLGAGILWPV